MCLLIFFRILKLNTEFLTQICRINPFQWTDVDTTVDLSARVIIPQPAPIGLQYQLQQQQPHGVAQYIVPGDGASIELSIFPTNVDLYN